VELGTVEVARSPHGRRHRFDAVLAHLQEEELGVKGVDARGRGPLVPLPVVVDGPVMGHVQPEQLQQAHFSVFGKCRAGLWCRRAQHLRYWFLLR
jgi:hypothetical protein